MKNGLSYVFCFFSLYFLAVTDFLYASDFHSPRTEALGGAGHASPLLSDALYLNPSFASFMQVHSLSVNYLKFGGGSTPEIMDFHGQNFNISVLDGTQESLFQAGVGYTRRDDSSMIHVGASKALFSRFGVGLGSKFILPNIPNSSRVTDGTFSMTGLLGSWFQTAFIVDNLFQSAPGLGFDREFILGTKFNFSPYFMIYLDPHYVPNLTYDKRWGYQAGLELPFFKDFFVRVGYFRSSNIPYQAQRGNGYGLGLGWVGPKISFDYSYSRVLIPLSSNAHNMGMTVFF